MWPRTVTIMLGLWLAISPFVFRLSAGEALTWANDLLCATLVIGVGCASFWHRLRYFSLVTPVIGLWLVLSAYVQARPLPPPQQNHILVGLLLIMFGIIPDQSSQPPVPWRRR